MIVWTVKIWKTTKIYIMLTIKSFIERINICYKTSLLKKIKIKLL